jgi:P27 family predicted phage terminase small subunit
MPNRHTPPRLRSVSGAPERPSRNLSVGLDVATPPPAYLDRVGRAEWRRVLRFAAKARPTWIQTADAEALAGYCATFAAWTKAAAELADERITTEGRSSADRARKVRSAAFVAFRQLSAELRGWIAILGFSPDSRGKVDVGDRGDNQDDRRRAASQLLSGGI